jgi:secreted trypsin-like serine protease
LANYMKIPYLIPSILLASTAVFGLASKTQAIVISGGKTSAEYEKAAVDYPSVGKILLTGGGQRLCSGTLVDPQWVLTASHCLKPGGSVPDVSSGTFSLGKSEYQFDSSGIYINPGWSATNYNLYEGKDVSLVKLNAPVADVKPAQLYTDTTKAGILGTTGTMVGFGNTGTAATGQVDNTYGTKRAGTNTIDGFGPDANKLYTDGIALHDFDAPDGSVNTLGAATQTPLEYTGGQSDSGGGWFIGGKLAGVNTGRISVNGQRQPAQYGSVSAITRLGYDGNLNWVNSTISGTAPKTTPTSTAAPSETGESLELAGGTLLEPQSATISDNNLLADRTKAVPEPSIIFAALFTGSLFGLLRRHKTN